MLAKVDSKPLTGRLAAAASCTDAATTTHITTHGSHTELYYNGIRPKYPPSLTDAAIGRQEGRDRVLHPVGKGHSSSGSSRRSYYNSLQQ